MEWHQLLLLLFYVVKQTVTTSMRLKCGDTVISGSLEPARTPPVALLNKEFKPWRGDICGSEPVHSSYIVCRDKCDYDCLQNLNGTHLIISKRHTFEGIRALWYRYEGEFAGIKTSCIMTEETGDSSTSTDALRSFSKTSVLFVSISFIILMVISLAWLVFYYVQRFRYAHAKDRLQRRLFNAARKALARIPTRALRAGDIELDTDCAVCIDPYQASDVVRTLPCRHVYHKSCIDPWLLEHRTCPMCKADILKYFGYQVSAGDASRVEIERDAHEHDSESPEPASSSSDSIAFPFPTNSPHDPFHFAPVIAPQLVMNQATAKSFAIVPLTVHPKPAHGRDITDIEQPSTSSSVERPDRASSAGAVDKSAGRSLHSRAGSQGQVVNIVQVRSRAQSCTRPVAVTIRKHERQPQPTAVEQETTEPV